MTTRQPFRFIIMWVATVIVTALVIPSHPIFATFLSILIPIADATGLAASKKGRNYWAFFLLSFPLPIIVWLVVAAMQPIDKVKKGALKVDLKLCKFCAEEIKADAILCKHCGKDQV